MDEILHRLGTTRAEIDSLLTRAPTDTNWAGLRFSLQQAALRPDACAPEDRLWFARAALGCLEHERAGIGASVEGDPTVSSELLLRSELLRIDDVRATIDATDPLSEQALTARLETLLQALGETQLRNREWRLDGTIDDARRSTLLKLRAVKSWLRAIERWERDHAHSLGPVARWWYERRASLP